MLHHPSLQGLLEVETHFRQRRISLRLSRRDRRGYSSAVLPVNNAGLAIRSREREGFLDGENM